VTCSHPFVSVAHFRFCLHCHPIALVCRVIAVKISDIDSRVVCEMLGCCPFLGQARFQCVTEMKQFAMEMKQ